MISALGYGKTKPAPGARVNRSNPFGQSLVNGWLFNEGGGNKCHSVIGNQFNVSFNQWTTFQPAHDWNAGFPNGPAFEITSGSNGLYTAFTDAGGGNIIENGDSFTISVIFMLTAGGYLCGRGNDRGSSGWGIDLSADVGSAPTCAVVTTNPSTAGYTATGTTTITAGKWYHVVGVWRPAVQVEIWVRSLPGGTARREGVTTTTSSSLRNATGYGFNFNLGSALADIPQSTGRYGHILVAKALPDSAILDHLERPYELFLTSRRFFFNTAGGAGQNHDASVLVVSLSIPAPSVSAGANITAGVLTISLSLPSPTIAAGATVTAPVLSISISVNSPVVTAGASVSPDPLTITLSAPVATAGVPVVVSPSVLTVSLSIPSPSMAAGATISVAVLTVSLSVPAPVISAGATVQAGVLTITLTAPNPTAGVPLIGQVVRPEALVISISSPAQDEDFPLVIVGNGIPAAAEGKITTARKMRKMKLPQAGAETSRIVRARKSKSRMVEGS